MLADHGHGRCGELAQTLSGQSKTAPKRRRDNTHNEQEQAEHKITKTGVCLSLCVILSSRRGCVACRILDQALVCLAKSPANVCCVVLRQRAGRNRLMPDPAAVSSSRSPRSRSPRSRSRCGEGGLKGWRCGCGAHAREMRRWDRCPFVSDARRGGLACKKAKGTAWRGRASNGLRRCCV